jgi:hypothetical protein
MDKPGLKVSNRVRQHRLISVSYSTLLPCHGRGRGFESRRPRHHSQTRLGWWLRLSSSIPLAIPSATVSGFVAAAPSRIEVREEVVERFGKRWVSEYCVSQRAVRQFAHHCQFQH